MYAHHLLSGHSLLCKSIKAATAAKYLANAASFLAHFDPVAHRDARRRSPHTTSLSPEITAVLSTSRRLESVPDRREPLTLQMQQHLRRRATRFPVDSITAALADWFAVGLLAGFRKSEWCQDKAHHTPGTHALSVLNDPIAITIGDVTFTDHNGVAVCPSAAGDNDTCIKRVTITWRWQKNGERHVKKGFSRNAGNTSNDVVAPWLNIVARFRRLFPVSTPPSATSGYPIAVYRNSCNVIQNITDTEVEQTMQSLATTVYAITDKKDLAKFSCHSIRVGACCILQAAGARPEFIKKQLRWNSDAWMAYTRDLAVLSHQHNAIINAETDRPGGRF